MAEEEEDDDSGGTKKKLIIIIAAVVLLLGLGLGSYFMFFSGEEDGNMGNTAEQREGDIVTNKTNEIVKIPDDPLFTPVQAYTVNMRDGKHFLKISIIAVLEDIEALTYLNGRMPLVDDMIITLLHNTTAEDLRTSVGVELLKREIFKKVNSVFTQEFIQGSDTKDRTPVKKILFKEFLLN